MSEASIGNVGMHSNTTGWVDHVVTPLGALGFMVVEDAVDCFVIARIEAATQKTWVRRVARGFLNPSRSLSNAAQGRALWDRVGRPIR